MHPRARENKCRSRAEELGLVLKRQRKERHRGRRYLLLEERFWAKDLEAVEDLLDRLEQAETVGGVAP